MSRLTKRQLRFLHSKKGSKKGFVRYYNQPEGIYLGRVKSTRTGEDVEQKYLKYMGVATKGKVRKFHVSIPKRLLRRL